MSMTMEEENIKVAVRIRPIQSAERKDGDVSCVKASPDGKEVQVKVGPLEASSYRCNQCFSCDTSQSEFFNECGITELLDSAMKGYRACAFAFGQTGAGKTFTMVGAPKGAHNRDKQAGLISRSLEYLFHKLEAAGVQFSIKISCLEIYHEQVFDLFAEERDRAPLAVREHAADGFFIEGCKLVDCATFPIANAALDAAVKNRQTGSHDLNSRSSRSHCLTEIHIEIPVTVGQDGAINGGVTYGAGAAGDRGSSGLEQGEYMSRGKVSLVDLAGSERLKTTKSTGKVLQEAGFINKSLYVLGKVIAGLIRTNGDLNHKDVPYRDSKLTKLLISSLGGRSRTLLISCVSEAKSNQAETLRTLKFSMSCARIRNKPMKFLDPQEKLILDLKEEIRRLRNENRKLRSNLLTAPASGEKGRLSEDEDSSVMSRAYSAHSSLEKERLKFKPNHGGKVYGTKMHSSQSDYIKRLSPLKKGKANRRNKREMTKDEALQMLDEMRFARRAQQFAASNASVAEGHESDRDTAESAAEGTDGGRSLDSAKRLSRRGSELEDLVRRRASGPMFLRGDSLSNISPVRQTALQTGYSPAQNKERNLDAQRIEELERRIARMEKGVLAAQKPFDHHPAGLAGGAHSMPLAHQLGTGTGPVHDNGAAEAVAGAQTAKRKKKKKAARPEEAPPAVWKGKMSSSPYIAHLISAAPTVAQDPASFGVRVVSANNPDKEVTLPAKPRAAPGSSEAAVPPKPAGRNSADNLRAAVAAASSAPAGKETSSTDTGPAKDLHSSILDELAELGLGPSAPQTKGVQPETGKKVAGPKLTTRAGDKERAASHSRARPGAKPTGSLPAMPAPVVEAAHQRLAAPKPSKAASKLPPTKKPASLPPMQSRPVAERSKSNDRSQARAPSASSLIGKSATPSASSAKNGAVATPVKKAATVSDPAALRAKLEALEQSLAEGRERMEDNPGEVTAEAEEHYEELAQEAKTLRRRLEMSGVELGLGLGSDTEDDGAPTPEAVRLMAREMERLSAPTQQARNQSKKEQPQQAQQKSASTKSPVKGASSTEPPAAMSRHSTVGGLSAAELVEAQRAFSPPKVTHTVTYTTGLRPPADTSLMFGASIEKALERDASGLVSPSMMLGSPSHSQGNISVGASAPAAEPAGAEEDSYGDDFEPDAVSKPSTAKKPDSPVGARPPLLQVKDFSRKFEQIELNVPDIERYTKAQPEQKVQISRHHSIHDDRIAVGRDNEETVGAVKEAFSFNYGDFKEDHPQILATAKELSKVPDRQYSSPPSKKVQTPSSPKAEAAAEEEDYGDNDFDTYEDDFAATTEMPPVADDPVREERESSPARPAVAAVSAKAAPPTNQAITTEGEGEGGGESYEEDNYEEEFEPEDDRPATGKADSVRLSPAKAAPSPSPKLSPPKAQSVTTVSQVRPAPVTSAEDEDEEDYPDFGTLEDGKSAYTPSRREAPIGVTPPPASPLASPPAAELAPSPKVTPAPAAIAPAPASTKGVTPGKARGNSRPATAAGEDGDEYGDEEFDEYEVSFEA